MPMFAAGCATQDAVDPATGRARFSEFPEPLYAAFRAACEGPAQSYVRPDRNFAECRELLPPDTTAAIILSYDGMLDDLPSCAELVPAIVAEAVEHLQKASGFIA